MPGEISGRTVVIIGASGGIGEATARTLAAAGARVALLALGRRTRRSRRSPPRTSPT